MGYESRWAMEAGLDLPEMQGHLDAIRFHEDLLRKNVATDALDPHCDLSRYRLVIAPRLWLVDEGIAANLRAFVERGGVLCLTAASGVVDEYNKSFDTPRPGPLAGMAGLEVSDLSPLEKPVRLSSAALPLLEGTQATVMADEIHSTSARVLARFASGWRKGLPALTENRWHKGRVFYLGTVLEGAALSTLVTHLLQVADVRPLLETPAGVRAYQRVGEGERWLFLINENEEARALTLPEGWRDAFTGMPVEVAEIGGVDVRILSRSDFQVQ